jgi:hypothetical protein
MAMRACELPRSCTLSKTFQRERISVNDDDDEVERRLMEYSR